MAAAIAGGTRDGPRRFLEARLVLSALLSMGVMMFSLILYSESVYGIADGPEIAFLRRAGRFVVAALALPVLALLGVPLLKGAFADLRRGAVRMDGLIVLATFTAFGLSLHETVTGRGEVYYETACMVLVLVTFGRLLEAEVRSKGRSTAELLAECLPSEARRLVDGCEIAVAPSALRPGDLVVVRPGESVPADATVAEGRSEVVLAHLTGEAIPRSLGPGDEILAGSVNGSGRLSVRVTRTVADGSFGRIREALEAPMPATRTTRLMDRVAGVLTAVSLGVALLGGLRSAWLEDPASGLETALAVLLVACPCALGLAVPLAYRAMRASLARQRILVRDPAALEVLPRATRIFLDKTGTLTRPSLGELRERGERADVFATLLASSGHALGRGVRAGSTEGLTELAVIPGLGVEATLHGRHYRLGRPDWVRSQPLDEIAARDVRELDVAGGTLVALSEGQLVVAVGRVDHSLRPEAEAAVQALLRRGVQVEILSGDRSNAVQPLAERLAIPAHAGMLPQDKWAHLETARRDGGVTVMVGDGINDAPALRHADVGIAMGTGTSLARRMAQIEILDDDLSALVLLLDGSRALRRCVRTNLAWTLGYNSVALVAAGLGRLHPILAVCAMIASSLVVALRSWALLGHPSTKRPTAGPSV